MPSIICGKCQRIHTSVAQVHACHFPMHRTTSWRDGQPSKKQLWKIKELSKQKHYLVNTKPLTAGDASDLITQLIKMETPTMNETPLIPLNMLRMIRFGRYAVPNNDQTEMIFLRVAETKGKNSILPVGSVKVQTKHAETWQDRLVVKPDGKVYRQDHSLIKGMKLADILIAVLSDQTTAAMEYAIRKDECARCGVELTDDKSRFFGLGPDCQKDWPHMVGMVIERKGEYVPGAASR